MILKTLKTALTALAANKTRSVLAVLGIVIGVSSVIMMIAMGKGAEAGISASIQNLGTNLVFVYPGVRARGGGHARAGRSETLTEDDAHAMRRLPYVRAVAADMDRAYQIKNGSRNTNSRVVGTWPDYSVVRDYKVARGRFITRHDLQGRRRVCVLGAAVARELFPYEDPLEQWVKIDRKNFLVVGVMEDKGGMRWMNFDEMVYVPLSTAMTRLMNRRHLDQIILSVDRPENVENAIAIVEAEMRRRHRIGPHDEPDFSTSSMTDWLERMQQMTGAFTILLSGIAVVSLLVGGIGIMNIMLVSVAERTREIGIRKAVGARKADILRQFLVESITISLLGGLLGIALGALGAQLIPNLPIWSQIARGSEWQSVIVPESITLAFGFSCAVGIFFGIYPAMKAAKLNPVEALRYE